MSRNAFLESEAFAVKANINEFARRVHSNAIDKGFHNDREEDPMVKLILIHSEVSEVVESYRKGNEDERCDKDIDLTNKAEECADIIIRTLDFMRLHEINVGDALLKKHNFNTGRGYKHGKQF